MHERPDALDEAYGRLSATRVTPTAGAVPAESGPRGAVPPSPRSLLLPRLALLRPRAPVRLHGTAE